MSFGAPEWLWGLVLLPVTLLLFVRGEARSAARLREFVAPRLLAQLGATVSSFRRRLRFGLLLAALALAFVSLAKPRWGYTYDEVQRKGLDLLVAIDTSRSMLANDVPPNRLQRVKLALQDLMNELRGDRIGVIAFAGRAFLQAPLTIDYGAAAETLAEIDTSIIPEGGTNISEAINLAVSTFGKSAMGNRALIIFTDGEELAGDATKVAKTAADAGVRIFTIGVGTAEGSLIPLTQAGGGTAFVKDKDGQVVKSKLDENRLREIAEATGGVYLPLRDGPATMRQLYDEQLGKLQAGDIAARTSRESIERYQWPLALAIAALAASLLINDRKAARRRTSVAAVYDRRTTSNHAHNGGHRPPLQTAAMLFVFLGPTSVGVAAAPGLEEYRSGRYEEAYRRFQEVLQEHPTTRAADKIQFDAGAAAYKMKDYGKALQSFSQALLSKDSQLQSRSHYNLGNTLYQRGETQKTADEKLKDWTNALQHYEQTLKLEPQNQQAKDNYEFVKKKTDELKQQQEQQPTPTPTPQQKDQKKQDRQQNQQKQQQKDEQQQQDQQQQQEGGEGEQQKPQPNQDQNEQAGQEQKPGQSPTPSPDDSRAGSSPTPSPGQSGSSPSPSPGKSDASPSPSPGDGQAASPTPSEGDTSEGQAGSSPTPGASPGNTPEKRPTGEVKGASEDETQQQENASEMAAVEAEDQNQMSEQQAENLLRSMRDEERRVQLGERKAVRRVYNDW